MKEFLIEAKPLEAAIKTLQPFASKEETRYYLCGVFFEWAPGDSAIRLVATDGHKLCVVEVDASPSDDTKESVAAIIPIAAIKTILQILKSIGNAKYPVSLRFTDRTAWIDTVDQKAELKLVDGTFPDYRRVMPQEKPNFVIAFQKEQAKEAMKAVATNKSKESMEWQIIDAVSPLKLIGDRKIVVVMPSRHAFDEIDLSTAA